MFWAIIPQAFWCSFKVFLCFFTHSVLSSCLTIFRRIFLFIKPVNTEQWILKKINLTEWTWTNGGLKKKWQVNQLSTTHEQYLKILNLRNRGENPPKTWPERCLRLFRWSIHCSLKVNHKLSQCKIGSQAAFVKKGKQVGKGKSMPNYSI